ncbi:hypothetical protein HGI30_12505 [Paenibacillus albicereus]|uniref:Uncharacterized protein n=1 Tax=Paenibacillus albicereus TaxID=2726185 RepID=A0A6H2GXZ2_9BACL|nr:flagellar hook-length control protein FliK [Paenibacillus albicereus]QJC52301.1 hypothetical protein HGI30_12505 [Paenibacillus albicereus]
MNIGSFLKAVGDLQPASSRPLELRPGQTVRATVLEAHGKDGALLQIGESQLLAKLETPLQPGQTAVLQVKGETDEGVLVLQLAARATKSAAEPEAAQWKELAGRLGLGAGDKGAAELVKAIRAAGLPLSAETADGLRTAAALKPSGIDPGEWLRAAASALQRGMPLTSETLLALRQALAGPPVHELLERLEQELVNRGVAKPAQAGEAAEADAAAKRGSGAASAGQAPVASAAGGRAAPQGGAVPAAAPADPSGAEAAPQAEAAKGGAVPVKAADHAARLLALLQSGPWLEPAADGASVGAQAARGVPAEAPSGKGATAGADGTTAAAGAKGGGAAAYGSAVALISPQGGGSPAGGGAGAPAAGPASEGGEAPAAAKPSPQGAVKTLLQWLGVGHEQQLARSSSQPSPAFADVQHQQAASLKEAGGEAAGSPLGSRAADGEAAATRAVDVRGSAAGHADASASARAAAGETARSGSEAAATASAAAARTEEGDAAGSRGSIRLEQPLATVRPGPLPLAAGVALDRTEEAALKPALLQLLAASDVPPGAREAATQLLQQITGQQLLLTPERSGAFFSQLTLQLPVRTADGAATATVQVQARRGAKGEVDASNCRLLFDLELGELGTTLVDVAVVDKVVSLTVYADHPAVPELLEAGRQSLTEQVHQAGYRLLGLRAADSRPQAGGGGADPGASLPTRPEWVTDRYRGVDMKI